MTAVVVYIIQTDRPWVQTERFMAHLKVCKRSTWALVDRLAGRRFKLGATAFLTVEAADKRREGLCAKNLQPNTAGMLGYIGLQAVVDASARARPRQVYLHQLAR